MDFHSDDELTRILSKQFPRLARAARIAECFSFASFTVALAALIVLLQGYGLPLWAAAGIALAALYVVTLVGESLARLIVLAAIRFNEWRNRG